jgi:outer membrane protein
MLRSSSIIVATLAFALGAVGPARAEDLLQIYREAQLNDPTLAAARANWQATQERVPQARAGLLPNVNLSASANGNYFGTNADTDPRVQVNRGFGAGGLTVSASQPLYRYANTVAYSQAVQQVEQADYTLASARQDLILRVATAYFDVLLAQFNVELAESQKAAVSEQLAQAKRNFEVGVATITDTNEAQAKYDSIVAQEISARNDLDN